MSANTTTTRDLRPARTYMGSQTEVVGWTAVLFDDCDCQHCRHFTPWDDRRGVNATLLGPAGASATIACASRRSFGPLHR